MENIRLVAIHIPDPSGRLGALTAADAATRASSLIHDHEADSAFWPSATGVQPSAARLQLVPRDGTARARLQNELSRGGEDVEARISNRSFHQAASVIDRSSRPTSGPWAFVLSFRTATPVAVLVTTRPSSTSSASDSPSIAA